MSREFSSLAYPGSITNQFRQAISNIARRWIGRDAGSAASVNAARHFIAERLVRFAAGAIFLVGPVCVLAATIGHNSQGAAVAIALTYLAVPLIAFGWLSISKSPWSVAILALASWAAMSGALASISPLTAVAGGIVLFWISGSSSALRDARAHLAAAERENADDEAAAGPAPVLTCIELSTDGAIRTASGRRRYLFRSGTLMIDHIHLGDRIAFLDAMADVAAGRRNQANVTVRIDFAGRDEVQAFRHVAIDLAFDGRAIALDLNEADTGVEAPSDALDAADMARNRFLATVSHELRTPLNSIIGFSDILRRDLFGALANDRQREYVELIHSSGNHLLSVVNTILDVSKIDAGTYAIHRETFDLNETVAGCVSMLKPQAGAKTIAVELEAESGLDHANGDRRAVKQIVINLLSNALKYTPAGGDVGISTARRDGGFLIHVHDNGIGMEKTDLEIIGMPFRQADNSYTRTCEGTGLGLAVVKGLVGLHGGSLDIESAPGKGTQVRVFIPESVGREQTPNTVKSYAGKKSVDAKATENSTAEQAKGAHAVRLAG